MRVTSPCVVIMFMFLDFNHDCARHVYGRMKRQKKTKKRTRKRRKKR